jgi:hypothetical protein
MEILLFPYLGALRLGEGRLDRRVRNGRRGATAAFHLLGERLLQLLYRRTSDFCYDANRSLCRFKRRPQCRFLVVLGVDLLRFLAS